MDDVPFNLIENVENAFKEVKEIHKNDLYGEKPYFDYHIKNVYTRAVNGAISKNLQLLTLYKISILALYHDAHEDHNYSLELFKEKYGQELTDALTAISYDKANETREQYYQRVEQNELAKFVKFHDASENAYNSELEQDFRRCDYYLKAVERFKETRLT